MDYATILVAISTCYLLFRLIYSLVFGFRSIAPLVWFVGQFFSDTLSDSEELVNNTTYYVRSELDGCVSGVLMIVVTETVSRLDFDLFGFTYYPNPVNDILYFSSNRPIEDVAISNMLGQQINVNVKFH